jgi:VanZ family protein
MARILPILDSQVLHWIVTLLWTIFLTILLLQPEAQPIIPTGIPPAPPSFERELFFSSLHFLFFGITALLWCISISNYFELPLTLLSVALFIASYGLVTEFAQMMIPGRGTQIWDMAANILGVMLGIAVYRWWQKKMIL